MANSFFNNIKIQASKINKNTVVFFVIGSIISSSIVLLYQKIERNNLNKDSANALIKKEYNPSPIQKIELTKDIVSKKFSDINVDASEPNKNYGEFVPGQLLVEFKDLSTKKSFIEENTGSEDRTGDNKIVLLELPNSQDEQFQKNKTLETISNLKKDSRIQYSEPNIIYKPNYTPNDLLYPQQWHLNNQYSSSSAKGITAEGAWNSTKGNSATPIVIAIIDSAVDVEHPDLAANIFRNSTGSIVGKNIGDQCSYSDNAGAINTSCNHSFVLNSNNLKNTDYYHGTMVAGSAAAVGNNSKGVSGSCPSCKIMPLGLYGTAVSNQTNSFSKIYEAIDYAIANGANIINMSFGSNFESNLFKNKIQQAHQAGITMFASAGNCDIANVTVEVNGCSYTNEPSFPASYEFIISVAASDTTAKKASFSNHNTTTDLTAPGVYILTTHPDFDCPVPSSGACYTYASGTSFSSPITAGVAGLILSVHPTWSPTEIETKLKSSSDDVYTVNPMYTGTLGSGLVNACRAVDACDSSGNIIVTTTTLNLKIFLSGNFVDSTDTMTTALKTANLIPTAQPYNVAPFNYSGAETATTIASDIVDWVLVEIKDSTGTSVLKKAGLLKSSGEIVDSTSGASDLTLPASIATGQYKVIIRHRNHLAIATDVNVAITANNTTTVDFTKNTNVKGANQLLVGTNPSSANLYGMRRANISGDDTIDSLDRTISNSAIESLNVYVKSDVNLDGITDSLDRTISQLALEAVENV